MDCNMYLELEGQDRNQSTLGISYWRDSWHNDIPVRHCAFSLAHTWTYQWRLFPWSRPCQQNRDHTRPTPVPWTEWDIRQCSTVQWFEIGNEKYAQMWVNQMIIRSGHLIFKHVQLELFAPFWIQRSAFDLAFVLLFSCECWMLS